LILPLPPQRHDEAFAPRPDIGTLDRFRGAKLTYVDASSLTFMEQRAIKRAWATDHHLGLAGAEVLPRS
jgi:hypothetical protein